MESKKLFCYLGMFLLVVSLIPLGFSLENSSEERIEIKTFGEKIFDSLEEYKLSGGDFNEISLGLKVEEYYDYYDLIFVGPNTFGEGFSFLNGIKSSIEAGHESYIVVNKESKKIEEADFSTSILRGFIIGNNVFVAPKDSRIKVIGDKVEMDVPDGSVLEEIPSFLDPMKKTGSFEIEGKDIDLGESGKLIEGKVEYIPEGLLVKEGEVSKRGIKFSANNKDEQVLISDEILEDYEGNSVYLNPEILYLSDEPFDLRVQSKEGGLVNLDFSEDYGGYLVGDESTLRMQVMDGDGIELKRSFLTHKSSEQGQTRISAGDFGTFVYTKEDVLIENPSEDGLPNSGFVQLSLNSDSPELKDFFIGLNSDGSMDFLGEKEEGFGSIRKKIGSFNANISSNLKGFSLEGIKRRYGENWKNIFGEEINNYMEKGNFNYEDAVEVYDYLEENEINSYIKEDLLSIFKQTNLDPDNADEVISFLENSPHTSRASFKNIFPTLIEKGYSKEESLDFISKVADLEISDKRLSNLLNGPILSELESGKNPDEIASFIKVLKKVSKGNLDNNLYNSLAKSRYGSEGSISILEKINSKTGRDAKFIHQGSFQNYLSLLEEEGISLEDSLSYTDKILGQTNYGDVWSSIHRGIPEAIEMGEEKGYSRKDVLDIISSPSSGLSSDKKEIKNLFLKYSNPRLDPKNIAAKVYSNGKFNEEYYSIYDSVKEKYGIRPMNSLPDLARYVDYQEDIYEVSKKTGVNPYLLYAATEQETFIGTNQVTPYESEESVFHNLGLNNMNSVQEILIRKGYLDENLRNSVLETNLNKIYGVAAELNWFREDYVFPAMEEAGISPNSLSEEQIDWWTYVAYNSGSGNARKWLKKYGLDFMYHRVGDDFGDEGYEKIKNVHFNAARVAGAAEIARKLGVFSRY